VPVVLFLDCPHKAMLSFPILLDQCCFFWACVPGLSHIYWWNYVNSVYQPVGRGLVNRVCVCFSSTVIPSTYQNVVY
jgi:hypothetical protein